jgi:hypothetical protein
MKLLHLLAIIAVLCGTWAQVQPEESVSIMCCGFEAMTSKLWSQFHGINNPCSTAPILETPATSSPDPRHTSPITAGNKRSTTQTFVPNTSTDSFSMSSSPDQSTSTLPGSSSSTTPVPTSTPTLEPFPMHHSLTESGPGPCSEIPNSTTKTPTWPMDTAMPTVIASSANLSSSASATSTPTSTATLDPFPLGSSMPDLGPGPCSENPSSETKPRPWPIKNLAARKFWPRCPST